MNLKPSISNMTINDTEMSRDKYRVSVFFESAAQNSGTD